MRETEQNYDTNFTMNKKKKRKYARNNKTKYGKKTEKKETTGEKKKRIKYKYQTRKINWKRTKQI